MLSEVLSSETGMPVSHHLHVEEHAEKLVLAVRWKGLDKSNDNLEPLDCIYKDAPILVKKTIQRKRTPTDNREKVEAGLNL